MINLKTFMPFCFTVMVHSLWTFYVNQGNLESDSKTKTTIQGDIWLEAWHCKKELDAKPFTSLFESKAMKCSHFSLFVL